MRGVFVFGALILVIVFAGKVSAASLFDNPNVAVIPFKNKAAISIATDSKNLSRDDLGEFWLMVSDYVAEDLTDTGRFHVIEREYLSALTQEYEYAKSGYVDEGTAVAVGKQVGVQFLVAGSVTSIGTKPSGINVDLITARGGFNKKSIVANITLRFINVETGEVVIAAHGKGESAFVRSEFEIRKTRTETYETDYEDESGLPNVSEEIDTKVLQQTISIGGDDYTSDQVANAIRHAARDAINDRKEGILAKMKKRGGK